jgi:hypothetical protein
MKTVLILIMIYANGHEVITNDLKTEVACKVAQQQTREQARTNHKNIIVYCIESEQVNPVRKLHA